MSKYIEYSAYTGCISLYIYCLITCNIKSLLNVPKISHISLKISQASRFPAKSPDSRNKFVFLPKQPLLELSPPVSMGDWKQVMFRFADVNTIRVIYSRKAGAPNKDKEEFDKFLLGTFVDLVKNVTGFYKYSPADNKRNPAWVLPPYPISTSRQTMGSQNITVARISGLT